MKRSKTYTGASWRSGKTGPDTGLTLEDAALRLTIPKGTPVLSH
jgi:hypothetical protein